VMVLFILLLYIIEKFFGRVSLRSCTVCVCVCVCVYRERVCVYRVDDRCAYTHSHSVSHSL